MEEDASATLVVNSVLVHASTAYPAAVKQGDPQAFKFSTEAYVLSPYKTIAERTKIRWAPKGRIMMHILIHTDPLGHQHRRLYPTLRPPHSPSTPRLPTKTKQKGQNLEP